MAAILPTFGVADPFENLQQIGGSFNCLGLSLPFGRLDRGRSLELGDLNTSLGINNAGGESRRWPWPVGVPAGPCLEQSSGLYR